MRSPALLLGLLLLAAPLEAQDAYAPADAYADWGSLLDRYVVDGLVDYTRWKDEDPAAWGRFLGWLAAARPESWTIEERRAFWINAYNARTIAGVLARYPIDSVRDVGFFGGRLRGFFSRREHPVAGQRWTLDEIEDDVLRDDPLFDDRVHWALNCASLGCPPLRPEPYRAARLDTQLDFQARTYLNGPSGHRLDPASKVLRLSRIFDWYRSDFERDRGSIRAYAARYLTGAASDAARDPEVRIEFLDYDWSLNDAR